MGKTTTMEALFFFSSRRRHTRFDCDWSSDVCSSDLGNVLRGWPIVLANLRKVNCLLRKDVCSGKTPPLECIAGVSMCAVNFKTLAFQIGRASCRERV